MPNAAIMPQQRIPAGKVQLVEPPSRTASCPLLTSHQWFMLVGQGHQEEVGISVRTPAKDEIDPAGLVAEVEARSLSTIAVEVLDAPASGMPDPDTFDGRWPLGGDFVEVHLSCRVREWSLDMAGFTADLVSDATRARGVRTPAAISIFRTG
ncbi:hypothetical protein [Saccharopolyspora sp. NPDC049426]|uniref:hypothetical protein n=1 Tax=Saccharopolyspora sp. NPDC049426 TaxID=3155652 RepID=UPI0034143022